MVGAARRAELECLINHVFLPPKLPGHPDKLSWERDLLEFLYEALDKFCELVAESDRPCVDLAAHAIKNFKQVTTPAGHISEAELANALRRTDGESDLSALSPLPQNKEHRTQNKSEC
jgi:hypothetical protein